MNEPTPVQGTEQSPGTDPRVKRNSGLFAFFKWFKPGSRESVVGEDSSRSGSLESVASDKSSGTVASFRYVSPTVYQNKVIQEKHVVIGPETDTYKARLKQRDKRRESDKNVTLRKKYNLFFNKETLLRPQIPLEEDENSKSLPLMTKTHIMEDGDVQKVHRRTNSESSKVKRAGAYVHVKGKRKAPQPPVGAKLPTDSNSMASLKRKKRLAPTPPPKIEIQTEKEVLANDYLKLDHGMLKPVKDDVPKSPSLQSIDNLSNSRLNIIEAPVSPRPWYKRNSVSKDTLTSKENKYEPIERLPEVPFKRNSTLDLTLDDTASNDKEKRRKSGLSFLTNISELDREASEIIRNKAEQEKLKNSKPSRDFKEIPEFMKPKDIIKPNANDSWVSPKRRSARDLIAKFNAITNVTRASVFGGSHKAKHFSKQISLDEARQRQEQLLQNHKKCIEVIDKKREDKFAPLAKSESASAVKLDTSKESTPRMERKNWKCPKCNLENEYWRIICHVCSAIKPYFDDFTSSVTSSKSGEVKMTNSPLISRKELLVPQNSFIERSKTQIGFSALASYNNKTKSETKNETENKYRSKIDETSKKEERERLKKMLIEMKNSLPKRKSNILMKQNSRTSIIMENPEDNKDVQETKEVKPVEKTQEEQVAEILIGSTQTIYENIKMRKSNNPKPLKLSSAVQTTAAVKKIVPESTLKKLIENHHANNVYEPMKVQDFENIYADKNGKTPSRLYANLAQNDELSLFFNVPKTICNLKNSLDSGANDGKVLVNHTDTLEVNRLLRRLETAIAKGDMREAAIFAKELAQLKVNCSVIRQKPQNQINEHKGFEIEMYVEDKVSHRGPFPIFVTEEQTVIELKQQISRDFEIPVEVQKWILGKELVTDDNTTLKDHNITRGCPVFLYLVAPDKKARVLQKIEANQPSISSLTDVKTKSTRINFPNDLLKNLEVKTKNSTEFAKVKEAPKIVNVIPKMVEPFSVKPEIVRIIPIERPIQIKVEDKTPIKLTAKTFNVNPPPVSSLHIDLKLDSSRHQAEENKELKSGLMRATSTKVEVFQAPPIVITNGKTSQNNTVKTESLDVRLPGASVIKPDTSTKIYPDLIQQENTSVKSTELEQNTLKKEWECHLCTLLNPDGSNVCAVCASVRIQKTTLKKSPKKKPAPQPLKDQTYLQLVNLDSTDLVPNAEAFECMVCFLDVPKGDGVTLRECLHQFCKDCLARTVEFAEEAEVKCPYRDEDYSCNIALQDREIKAIVSPDIYEQHLAKSVSQAENQMERTFHCKTPDCKGWCIFEDNVNEFRCPVCRKTNCLTCQAIHMGANCKQYQQRMEDESDMNEDAKRTKDFLEEMVEKGEAIACPTCKVILMKKWGCDWLRCSMCKTEICWVTRGPRWGPAGKGDTSGGCQCGVNGVKCHPKCNYCH